MNLLPGGLNTSGVLSSMLGAAGVELITTNLVNRRTAVEAGVWHASVLDGSASEERAACRGR